MSKIVYQIQFNFKSKVYLLILLRYHIQTNIKNL